MKRNLKIILSIAFMFVIAITLTGCGSEGETKVSGKDWPSGVSYIPNLPYEGKGSIVEFKEDKELEEYSIYINGATLDSANEYIQKLYDNGWTKMNMFSDDGDLLKTPKKDNFYKLGFDSSDEKSAVVVIIHDGNPKVNGIEYNLVLTFANMDY